MLHRGVPQPPGSSVFDSAPSAALLFGEFFPVSLLHLDSLSVVTTGNECHVSTTRLRACTVCYLPMVGLFKNQNRCLSIS